MWSRRDLKEKAKGVLRRSYWRALIVSFIIVIAGGALNSTSSSSRGSNNYKSGWNGITTYTYSVDSVKTSVKDVGRTVKEGVNDIKRSIQNNSWMRDRSYSWPVSRVLNYFSGAASWIWLVMAGVLTMVIALLSVLFRVLIGYNLEVGGRRYFLRAAQGDENISNTFNSIKSKYYVNIIGAMFLRGLYTFLWSLLFVIPGVVKKYAYRMVPYILAENPGMSPSDAIAESCRMTYGHKMDMFIMDISFWGWYFLGALAFGIGTFFVNPYVEATYAQLYLSLKGGTVPEPTKVREDEYIDMRQN